MCVCMCTCTRVHMHACIRESVCVCCVCVHKCREEKNCILMCKSVCNACLLCNKCGCVVCFKDCWFFTFCFPVPPIYFMFEFLPLFLLLFNALLGLLSYSAGRIHALSSCSFQRIWTWTCLFQFVFSDKCTALFWFLLWTVLNFYIYYNKTIFQLLNKSTRAVRSSSYIT